MNPMNLKKLILTLAALACVGSSFAQGFGGGGGGQRRGFGMMGEANGPSALLNREEVQDELKLTDDQKTKLSDIRQSMRQRMQDAFQEAGISFGGGGGGGGFDRTKMQPVMEKVQTQVEKEVEAVLTPDQLKRVHEIAVSTSGYRAITLPFVKKDLGLTEAQDKKVKELVELSRAANMSLFQQMMQGELDREQLRPKMEANRKALDTELGKLLTEEQKKKLTEMGGKPFTLKEEGR